MRARRKWILLLIGLIIVGTVVWNLTREREPVYEGRTLSAWLLIPAQSLGPGLPFVDATLAIRKIGTNAIPYLLKWIHKPSPPPWRQKIAELVSKLPSPLSSDTLVERISGRRDQYLFEAVRGTFTILGPTAAPAIPELKRLSITANDRDTRHTAIRALGSIGPQAIPALLSIYPLVSVEERWQVSTSIEMQSPLGVQIGNYGFIKSFLIHPDLAVRVGATNFALAHAPYLLTNAPPR